MIGLMDSQNGGRVVDTRKVSERNLDAAQTMRELCAYQRIAKRQEILATKALTEIRRRALEEANELDEQSIALASSKVAAGLGERLVWAAFAGFAAVLAAMHWGWL